MSGPVPLSEAFDAAAQHHRAGRLVEAGKIYQQILQADPNNAQALHRLGRVASDAGKHEAAVTLIGKAIAIEPPQALFHVSLGEAYVRWGKLEEAVAANRKALELAPNLAIAHTQLGLIAHARRDFAAAETSFRRAAALDPTEPQTHANLGRALYDQRRLAEAEAEFREAARLVPASARAQFNLAAILHEQGKLDEAVATYRRSLELKANDPDVQNNLGMALAAQGALAEAEKHYREAIRINPRAAMAHNNLAIVLSDQGRIAEAVDSYQAGIRAAPDFAPLYANMARPLQNLGRIDEAIAAAQQALALNPRMAAAYCNLGMCQQERGQIDEAVASYRQGLAADPNDWKQHANLIYALNYQGGLDPQTVFEEHCAWGRRHANPWTARSAPHANDRTPDRRLRIGYVSGHFRSHAVAVFAEPMLAAHDHERFEIFCYSNWPLDDETTARFRAAADHWRPIATTSDDDTAELIRRDKIDILVDLDGHINDNRLLLFARKPAPLEVTYLGYQNTTGMAAMDYRLTDDHADPPGTTEPFYTERLVRLSPAFFCYRPDPLAPPLSTLPALERGYVTFGSFNQFAKVTPEVLATWAQLLRAVAGARLMIVAYATPWLERHVAETFERQGVERSRVELVRRRPHQQYLELISQVDVALDPFPFNGHTTTCDCLWQGIPVVTLAGRTYAARFGSTAHVNLDLDDLVADSPELYVEIAARLAGDLARLQELRGGLRARMAASPLLDAAGFTRRLEAAYRQMWAQWCSGS